MEGDSFCVWSSGRRQGVRCPVQRCASNLLDLAVLGALPRFTSSSHLGFLVFLGFFQTRSWLRAFVITVPNLLKCFSTDPHRACSLPSFLSVLFPKQLIKKAPQQSLFTSFSLFSCFSSQPVFIAHKHEPFVLLSWVQEGVSCSPSWLWSADWGGVRQRTYWWIHPAATVLRVASGSQLLAQIHWERWRAFPRLCDLMDLRRLPLSSSLHPGGLFLSFCHLSPSNRPRTTFVNADLLTNN